MNTGNVALTTGWTAWRFRVRALRGGAVFSLMSFLLTISTAFGIIYTKDLHRRMFIAYQKQVAVQRSEQVRWGKLLLEESAWSTQARIQRIAENRLSMVVPAFHSIVMVAMNQGALVNPATGSLMKHTVLAENDRTELPKVPVRGT